MCPACTLRRNQLVNPGCPVCDGHGVLLLGDGALALYTPDVVAEAVLLSFEAVARNADRLMTLSDKRSLPLRDAKNMLKKAGVIGTVERALPPAPPAYKRTRKRDTAGRYTAEPTELAETWVQTELFSMDTTLAHAPKYEYQQHERPNARGLPVLSSDGHPSHLARVTDPQEPGRDTLRHTQQQTADHTHAKALAAAAPVAAAKATRKIAKYMAQHEQETP